MFYVYNALSFLPRLFRRRSYVCNFYAAVVKSTVRQKFYAQFRVSFLGENEIHSNALRSCIWHRSLQHDSLYSLNKVDTVPD